MLSITQCYLDFVDKILKTGKETYKDSNHHLLESLGNFYVIDDAYNEMVRERFFAGETWPAKLAYANFTDSGHGNQFSYNRRSSILQSNRLSNIILNP